MNRRKIFFRADASSQIGYGHFIRCLALADMLKEDFDCSLFTQTPSAYQEKEAADICPLISLPADDSRFVKFLEYLDGSEIVVLDNYFYTIAYQQSIRSKGCCLVCIDDMHDRHYVADVVINYGADNSFLFSVEPYTKLCLGLEWSLLRKPFRACKLNRKEGDGMADVVVCFGGSDPHRLTDRAIAALNEIVSVQHIDAIVGERYVSSLSSPLQTKVTWHRAVSAEEMAQFFSACDLAVLSASSVCIEALACGAKIAAGWYVDNQIGFYEYIKNDYLYLPLGNLLASDVLRIKSKIMAVDRHHDIPSLQNVTANSEQRYINLFRSLQ